MNFKKNPEADFKEVDRLSRSRHVGQRVVQIIAERFSDLGAVRKAGREDLEQIDEIGAEIARSVVQFFREEENRRVLERLFDAGLQVQKIPSTPKKRLLEGKTFVFTGNLSAYTRSEAESLVEDLGGRATSSVSGRTDYVVAGRDPGSKLEDARSSDAEIIDERAFDKMTGGK